MQTDEYGKQHMERRKSGFTEYRKKWKTSKFSKQKRYLCDKSIITTSNLIMSKTIASMLGWETELKVNFK